MKLELREIAPYLPYGLKVLSGRGTVFLMNTYSNMRGSGIESRDLQSILDEQMKPILRPLSDLDNYLRNEFEKLDRGYAYDKIAVDLFCEENGVSELIENTEINSLPYECVEYMFEHHYDVFNLHENGLCIYYNEL